MIEEIPERNKNILIIQRCKTLRNKRKLKGKTGKKKKLAIYDKEKLNFCTK